MQNLTLPTNKKDGPAPFNYFNRLSILVKETHNTNWMKDWMKDWMKQPTNYKHNPEVLKPCYKFKKLLK